MLSLTARGLTTGEVAAQNRPLDRIYPVVFIDALVVKVRDGQVGNKPFYLAVGVTVNGERDILGIWAGDGGEGSGEVLARGAHRDQEPWH